MRKLLLAATALIALSGAAHAYDIDIIGVVQRDNPIFGPDQETLSTFAGVGVNQRVNGTGANAQVSYSSVNGSTADSGLFAGNVLSPSANEASVFGDFNSTRTYLAAGGGGGSVKLDYLGGNIVSLGMLWGTLDFGTDGTTRNRIVTNGGDVITGDAVAAECAAEGFACISGQTEVWLRITNLTGFNSAIFSDANANSFEFAVRADEVAAVPEASTWAMMIAGFFGVGGMAMRKRRNDARAFRFA